MTEIKLTQNEAEALIRMEKQRESEEIYDYPSLGGSVSIPLSSFDNRERFALDLSRGRIDLMKGKNQTRGRNIIVLVRLDFGGSPHRNPDGEEIQCPHLHIFKEGYGDKWAIPAPVEIFSDISDNWRTLKEFMDYCNIVDPPNIKGDLFI